jgi:hypothetical protein
MSIEDARSGLQRAALAYAADQTPGNARQLEAEARDFSRAQLDAATGVTAATFQQTQDEKRGVRPCPNCRAPIAPSYGRWLDARTNRPHQCRRR